MSIARVNQSTYSAVASASANVAIGWTLAIGNVFALACCSQNADIILAGNSGGLNVIRAIQYWNGSTPAMLFLARITAAMSRINISTQSGSTLNWATAFAEYSGVDLLIDKITPNGGAAGTGTAADSGASATTTIANALQLGVVGASNGPSLAAGTGWTSVGTISTGGTGSADRSVILLENIVSSTGTVDVTATLGTSHLWAAGGVSLAAIPSGGGLLVPPSMAGVPE